MNTKQPARASILVVEDSDSDFSVCTRMRDEQVGRIEIFQKEAASLKNEPSLIVLNLNLPGLDGREVLKRVRAHGTWNHIPVVVFSAANNPAIVSWYYESGANACHVKEMNRPAFRRSVEMLANYWLESAQLPRGDELPATSPRGPAPSRS